jgi:hypothetical protein
MHAAIKVTMVSLARPPGPDAKAKKAAADRRKAAAASTAAIAQAIPNTQTMDTAKLSPKK